MATQAAQKTASKENNGNQGGRERKPPPAMHERMKNQLTNAALRGKIQNEDLEQLEQHIGKLKNLLT